MKVSTAEELIAFVRTAGKVELVGGNDLQLYDAVIENLNASWFCASRLQFIRTRFINCFFDDFQFNGAEFIDCYFISCIFQNVTFMDCSIANSNFTGPFSNTLLFGMTTLKNVKIERMEFQFTTFSDCSIEGLTFKDGSLHTGKFETGDFTYAFKTRAVFDNVSLSGVLFNGLDLTETIFKNSTSGAGYVNCKLSPRTFEEDQSSGLSSVDFFSLLQSQDLPAKVLRSVFGIKDANIKSTISLAMDEPKFHTAFISYSFCDKETAMVVTKLLEKNSVKTFLWENDAPGGRRMKKIMIDGIRDCDKFLFIASKDSLKSQACHFEIREAREKYYKTWADVFVPIHLDDYLLTVRKEDIPSKVAKEYWQNISELREFHSLDFTFMNGKSEGEIEVCQQFPKLLKALKIKKQ